MSGKTYVGNSSNVAKILKKIYAGNSSNVAKAVKVVYCGNSSGKAVEVWRNSTLPSMYQKVEYIYNTGGTQYIDTGVKPNSDTTIIVDFTPTSFPSGTITRLAVFGLYTSQSVRFALDANSTQNQLEVYFGQNSSHSIAKNLSVNTRYLVEYNKSGGKFYVNGTLGYTSTYTFGTINRNMLLFGQYVYDSGNTPAFPFIQMHHFQVKQSNVLIRDMYPCYLKSNTQTVGMYDLINGQFYSNSGTGIFYKGPDVN